LKGNIEIELDEPSRLILQALQADARLSFNQLAKQVGLSAPAVADRVRRLEEAGVIRGYRAIVDGERLGWQISAMARLTCSGDRYQAVKALCRELPEVRECHHVTGAACFHLKIMASSVHHMEQVIERLRGIGSVVSSVVLSTPVQGKPLAPP